MGLWASLGKAITSTQRVTSARRSRNGRDEWVTLAVAALVRAPGIPMDVRRHDAKVAGRDRALETWTIDRNYALRRECEALRTEVPSGGDINNAIDYPGARNMELMAESRRRMAAEHADRSIAYAKGCALHEWRDEAGRAAEDVAGILVAEGWAHRGYRRVFHRSAPGLAATARVAPILAAWRKPSAMSGGAMTWPDGNRADAGRRYRRHASHGALRLLQRPMQSPDDLGSLMVQIPSG
jgi:hypothetical protein